MLEMIVKLLKESGVHAWELTDEKTEGWEFYFIRHALDQNRLKRVEGQVRGVEKMLEEGAYCPDIMVQISAINSALNSFNKELLASHMKTCVVDDIRAGKDEVIDELVITLQKIMK